MQSGGARGEAAEAELESELRRAAAGDLCLELDAAESSPSADKEWVALGGGLAIDYDAFGTCPCEAACGVLRSSAQQAADRAATRLRALQHGAELLLGGCLPGGGMLCEGFAAPVPAAPADGADQACQVACRGRPSWRVEAAGDAALYITCGSPAEIAQAARARAFLLCMLRARFPRDLVRTVVRFLTTTDAVYRARCGQLTLRPGALASHLYAPGVCAPPLQLPLGAEAQVLHQLRLRFPPCGTLPAPCAPRDAAALLGCPGAAVRDAECYASCGAGPLPGTLEATALVRPPEPPKHMRVTRNPLNWSSGGQDGGLGAVGFVGEERRCSDGVIEVTWPSGQTLWCHWGCGNEYHVIPHVPPVDGAPPEPCAPQAWLARVGVRRRRARRPGQRLGPRGGARLAAALPGLPLLRVALAHNGIGAPAAAAVAHAVRLSPGVCDVELRGNGAEESVVRGLTLLCAHRRAPLAMSQVLRCGDCWPRVLAEALYLEDEWRLPSLHLFLSHGPSARELFVNMRELRRAEAPELPPPRGALLLCCAADWQGDSAALAAAVRELLRQGADANECSPYGHTPVYFAAGRPEFADTPEMQQVFRALATPQSVNRRDTVPQENWGCAALHIACFRGGPRITELVLDCGGDPTLLDSAGRTPLAFASLGSFESAIAAGWGTKVLERLSVPSWVLVYKDTNNWTPLRQAQHGGHQRTAALLHRLTWAYQEETRLRHRRHALVVSAHGAALAVAAMAAERADTC